ncbi:MAG TPA: SDR family oxidoreductase [Saprospiraceae bacterium]|nr:SDR family oxidoreductase [Saprospiraceae bacterium]HPN69952.1 SDR family oxidoreductase [Saprospiraceae bacterium]
MNEKTAFITGTSSGIGAATADFLCASGWKVYGTVRNLDDSKDLTSKYSNQFQAIVYDVRDVDTLSTLSKKIIDQLGDHGLDLLVNNAGIAVAGPLEEISNEDFEMQLDVNVKSVFRITNAFLPALIKNGQSNIINIGSISGLFTSPFLGAYAISKYALESMSDAYRRELLPFGVDVFCLEPGPIKTPIWKKTANAFDKFSNSRYAPYVTKIANLSLKSIKKAKPVEEVVVVIDQIIQKKALKPRYVIAANKLFYNFFRYILSDRFIDRQIKKKIYS